MHRNAGSLSQILHVCAIAVALVGTTAVATAGPPQVQFDVACVVGCRDVTPAEAADSFAGDRLVEARFQVSSLIHSGREDDLLEFFYRFDSRSQTTQIVDYLPKTTLTTEYAGNIGIEKKKEDTKSFGLGLSGSWHHLLHVNGNGGAGTKSNDNVSYELLPPMELISAAGTLDRGTSLYFKLKPSPRTTLQGGKEFVVALRVPETWRAELIYIDCRAVGVSRGAIRPLDEKTTCGKSRFVVALYLDGDQQAKETASELVGAEAELRVAAAKHRREIEKRSYPTLAYKLGAVVSAVKPKIPKGWLDELILGEVSGTSPGFDQHLPKAVQSAVNEYVEIRQAFRRLNDRPMQTDDTAQF